MRARDYNIIRSLAELQVLADKLLADNLLVAFDVETSYSGETFPKRALDVTHPDQYVCGFSITNDPSWSRYVPLRHDGSPFNLPVVEAWEIIRPVLERVEILAHHKKFEDKNLRMLGVKGDAHGEIRTLRGHDSMLEAYALGRFKLVGLKELSGSVLGVEQATFASMFGDAVLDKNGKVVKAKLEKQRFSALDPSSTKVVNYACDDTALSLELHHVFMEMLAREPKNRRFIHSLELLISDLMADAEIYGVGVDWEPMERQRALYKPFVTRLEKAVKEGFAALVKDPEAREKVASINFASAPQMQRLLYEDIGWRATRFSLKTGKPSTDKIALEALSRKYPVVKRLLQFREVNNLGGRHEKWLDEYRASYDGRVHPNFSQVKVVSGRFAADDPAIQQLPKHWYWDIPNEGETSEQVKASCANGDRYWEGFFRRYIIAAPGHYLLTFDYSQVELRVLAGVSREERLLQAFDNDEDVHRVTTAQMLGMRLEEVDDEKRQIGKTLNFALLYGMGVRSLSDRLAIPLERGRELYESYFRQFSSIDTWVNKTQRDGRREKWVESWFGRRIPLWDFDSEKEGVQKKGERVAVNGPIQGGAADYMKIAMTRVAKRLRAEGLWGKGVMITMNQHDSLTFEIRDDLDPNYIRAILQECVVFPVPGFPKIVADWEIGHSWGASAKWKLSEEAVWADGGWWPESVDPAAYAGDAAEGVASVDDDWDDLMDDGEESEEDESVSAEEVPRLSVLVVTCPEIPTKARLENFLALLRSSPGESHVELVLTDNTPRPLTMNTSLSVADSGRISLAIGGAAVRVDSRAMDLDVAISGLSL